MALHLSTPVGALPGIGDTAVKDLKQLGVASVRDLLLYFPYRYDDFSVSKPIPSLRAGDTVTITGTIRTIESRPAKNRRMTLTEAIVGNDSGELKAMWFNQPYLEKTLRAGSRVSLAGTVDAKFGITLVNPVHEPAGKGVHTGRIVPVYGRTGGLTIRRLRDAIASALRGSGEFAEWLPEQIRVREGFPEFARAIEAVHFPSSQNALEVAVARLKFDELFLHQLLYAAVRKTKKEKQAVPVSIDEAFLKRFAASLPFALTDGQKRAAWEIIKDCALGVPMNRLLEGDVGSGKTAVAAFAIANVLQADGACAYLAPTEILAAQQHASLSSFLDEPVALLTRSASFLGDEEIKKADLLDALAAGKLRIVVGTHALLQDAVSLPDLRLIVIDEQHRFGVAARHALLETGDRPAPHLLSMTATPIPRSLALTLYGDLDLSVIKERPKGRKPIDTRLVLGDRAKEMWKHAVSEIDEGKRVYVVCPLIDPSDTLGAKSVTEVAAELKKGPLKGRKLAILHGKMKADEKDNALREFRDGGIEALIATTVVEVGVDVPLATVMIILGAERFGLSQLHQLRGRVGRSDLPSSCYLVPDAFTPAAKERLRAMVRSQDGFALAEEDLRLRGAGNIFGNAQSGFPDFKLATPADTPLMKTAHDWAKWLLKEDGEFVTHPLVKQKVEEALDLVHLE